jgi:hypothetical protein
MVPPRSGREWGWEGLRASKSGQDKVVPVGLGIPGIIKAGVREGLSPIDRGKPCHNRGDKPCQVDPNPQPVPHLVGDPKALHDGK